MGEGWVTGRENFLPDTQAPEWSCASGKFPPYVWPFPSKRNLGHVASSLVRPLRNDWWYCFLLGHPLTTSCIKNTDYFIKVTVSSGGRWKVIMHQLPHFSEAEWASESSSIFQTQNSLVIYWEYELPGNRRENGLDALWIRSLMHLGGNPWCCLQGFFSGKHSKHSVWEFLTLIHGHGNLKKTKPPIYGRMTVAYETGVRLANVASCKTCC